MSQPSSTAPATQPAQATAEADVPRNADGSVDINHFVQMGQAELAQEAAAAEAAERETGEAGSKGKAERGKDGKFVKAETKEPADAKDGKDEQEAAAKDKDEEKEPADGRVPDSIARLRRLWRDGKALDVFRAITGDSNLQSLDGLHVPSRALAGLRKEISTATRLRADVEQRAQQLHQMYAPMEKAWQLRDSGDVKGAIEAFFNDSLENVQAAIVSSYAKTDPAVVKTQRELQQLREEIKRRDQQSEQDAQRKTLEQRQAEERQTLVEYLSDSDDQRISRVAGKKAFQDMVVQKMKEAYDPRTRIGIPWNEAAEQAYDDLYGDVIEFSDTARQRETTDRRPNTVENTARGRTPAKQKSLDPKRSAEAAPTDMPEPGTREFVDYWARRGQLEMTSGR